MKNTSYLTQMHKQYRSLLYNIKHNAYNLESAIEMIKEFDYYTNRGRDLWDNSKEDYFQRKWRLYNERNRS